MHFFFFFFGGGGGGLLPFFFTQEGHTVFADDNLKFEENGRKLLKPLENTVGKGEIAH